MPTRALWVVLVSAVYLACAVPAGAAQVAGSVQITGATATTVSFSVTAQRTCVTNEQCDYYPELDELDGDGPCGAEYPNDPWISWIGDVRNTGPATEAGTITPRHWPEPGAIGPSRLCLYIYADRAYYLAGSAVIRRPATGAGGVDGGQTTNPGGSQTTTTPGSTKPRAPGSSAPGTSPTTPGTKQGATTKLTCARYRYQQSAQAALEADPSLAAYLDDNGNGVACQGLPERKTYVRTVAKAASAVATKAALRKAYGTAFAKGTGYRARCHRVSRTRVRCAVTWRRKGTWAGYVDVVGAIRGNKQALLTRLHVRRP